MVRDLSERCRKRTLDLSDKARAEVALNFKNHGNELYAQKSYRDAIDAYTQGVDAGPKDGALRISLLNNRAACNLAMKNYGAVLRDTGVIIALTSKDGGQPPAKAMYRAAQSLVALERWEEARDCVARGKELKGEESNKVWETLGEQVEKGQRRVEERIERLRREKVGKEALRRAVEVSLDLYRADISPGASSLSIHHHRPITRIRCRLINLPSLQTPLYTLPPQPKSSRRNGIPLRHTTPSSSHASSSTLNTTRQISSPTSTRTPLSKTSSRPSSPPPRHRRSTIRRPGRNGTRSTSTIRRTWPSTSRLPSCGC